MTVSKISAGVGTAAFALGLSLLGPQGYGVAAADTGAEQSASTNSEAGVSQRASAGTSRPARASRNAGSPAATGRQGSAAAVTPRESARAAAAIDAVPVSEDAREPVGQGAARRSSAQGRSRMAAVAVPGAVSDTPAAAVVATVEATDTLAGRADPIAVAVVPAAATVGAAVTGPSAVVTRAVNSVADIANSLPWMSITPQQVNVAVNGWLDSVQTFLSSLGTNPVTELLEGALLLVRRSLFNQTPTARSYEYAKRADGELLGAMNVIDPEGARVTYRVSEAPEFGTASIDANGNWAYTPGEDFVSDRFAVTVDDGGFNIFDPTAGTRTVIVRVGDMGVQGFGDIPLYVQNDTGMALVSSYWGPRYQGTYNGLLSGPPDNFILQPGDSVAYESEAHLVSNGEAYEVVMEWQNYPGERQYLWTVRYGYDGYGGRDGSQETNPSCSLSSQPCFTFGDPTTYLKPPGWSLL